MALLLSVIACSEPPESPPPLKQVVVSGAIPAMQEPEIQLPAKGEEGVANPSPVSPAGNPATPPAQDMLPTVSDGPSAVPVSSARSVSPGSAPVESPRDSGQSPDVVEADTGEPKESAYSPEGKIDPFDPLIKPDIPAAGNAEDNEQKPKRILTPLEKMDLNQVKLVAVVMTDSGNIAMVEEVTGKGYFVNVGTYMGRNGGRVTEIENDRITVVESVKDYKGDIVERFHELVLLKPEIED